MIFYEAPHKLIKTLGDMAEVFGDRQISIVREITKLHEECSFTTLNKAIEFYKDNIPKGEYVLVVAGKSEEESESENILKYADLSVKEHVDMLIAEGLDKKQAIKDVAQLRQIPKRDVYNEYVRNE